MPRFLLVWFTAASFLLTACGQAGVGIIPINAPPTPTSTPATETVPPPDTPTPRSWNLTFDPETYYDAMLGFALEYPAEWDAPVLVEQQSRGSVVQASMDGKAMLDIVTLRWDPANNLDAFVEVREQAFEGSGITILDKQEVVLADNWIGIGYKVESIEGEQAYFFFTPISDHYLQLSGSGDLDKLAEIAATIRTID